MRLDTRFVRLALTVDAAALAAEVDKVAPNRWRPHPEGHVGNDALPLVAFQGDPLDDRVDGDMRPCPVLAEMPMLRRVLAALGVPIGRTRLMRIVGNGEASSHADTNRYWWDRYRVHVPIITTPGVQFLCGIESVHMAAGECWLFDTWSVHNVLNPDPTERIHLVVDTVGGPGLDRLRDDANAVVVTIDSPEEFEREDARPNYVMPTSELRRTLDVLMSELVGPAPMGLWTELEAWIQSWDRLSSTGERAAHLVRLHETVRELAGECVLRNGVRFERAVIQLVVSPAQLDAHGLQPKVLNAAKPHRPAPVNVPGDEPAARSSANELPSPRLIERPVIIVSPPRAGSTMLFETLARSGSVWSIGGESHGVIEGVKGLDVASADFASNRLTAEHATPEVADALIGGFAKRLRDRHNAAPPFGATGLRMLEKTPKNSLRVPFLDAVFPDANYVYLYRNPRDEISSMIDAWRSGKFVTYPTLPEWQGLPWSMLLVPGWQELIGKPIGEIAATQWATTTTILLDDLERVAPGRWCVARYHAMLTNPQAEVQRIAGFVGIEWDTSLRAGALPMSRHTLTPPNPDKWRKNWSDIEPFMHIVEPVAARAREIFGVEVTEDLAGGSAAAHANRPGRQRPISSTSGRSAVTRENSTPESMIDSPVAAAPADADSTPAPPPFRSVHTSGVAELLNKSASSIVVSTYQSGRLIVLRGDGASVNTHFRSFPRPMGLAVGAKGRLALGTKADVWEFRDQPAVAAKVEPHDKHDACYLPRNRHTTGDISIHEMAYDSDDELWVVNTRFSCLATLDADHSFVPRWQPSFITQLAAEDRCHLNGMAMVDGRPKYVTALGPSDEARGWREFKSTAGMIIDVDSNEVAASGLCMPHSPRWHNGKLWVLESGRGGLGVVDLATGKVETMIELPGFTRGLTFIGRYAIVGLSQVRESVFEGLPLTERSDPRHCGVWIIDTVTGKTSGFLRFEGAVQEVFDVQVLAGKRYPEIAEDGNPLIDGAFVVPDALLSGFKR